MPESTLDHLRHSLAHLLASAVLEIFPEAKLGVGPVIENGFFYDFLLPRTLTPEDLKELQKRMRKLVGQKLAFERTEMTTKEAKKFFREREQPFKVELIEDLEKEEGAKTVSIYKTGKFIDLCRGGHVDNTSEIDAHGFQLWKISGAYWRGDEKREQLQRIYGLAFESEAELKAHLTMLAEAEKRDHRKLGKELDLFTFSDLVGPGLPLFTPRGTLLRNMLDEFVWSLRSERGYVKVTIPHITKKELYETSGHWQKFKDDLFKIATREKHELAMKPMNCPHHTQIYARTSHSYRDLPARYAETTMVYRDEQSGELAGLSRVLCITQDDAHVFCRASQMKGEFLKIWDMIDIFYAAAGFGKLKVRLSLHDPKALEKYLGTSEMWQNAEQQIRELAKDRGVDYFESVGEAAFYGPKIDFMAKDSIGREWQVATIQLDINMPERFDLSCVNEKGEKERIVMIHAAIMGSLERFLSILIEHHAGAFPTWLAPVQVYIAPVGKAHYSAARKLGKLLSAEGMRVEVDEARETVPYKVRKAEKQKVPYVLVVGDREKSLKKLTVRIRGQERQPIMSMSAFLKRVKGEIKSKK